MRHLRAIAEGVEAAAQLETLERNGGPEAQGSLFAKPLAPKAVEKRLAVPGALDPVPLSHCA